MLRRRLPRVETLAEVISRSRDTGHLAEAKSISVKPESFDELRVREVVVEAVIQ